MLAQRKDRPVDHQRVAVVQSLEHGCEKVVVNLIDMGNQVEGLASDIDVVVTHCRQPLIIRDETLSNHPTKRQYAAASTLVDQVGAKYCNVVITNREAGAQK